jgi:hypothetical protein
MSTKRFRTVILLAACFGLLAFLFLLLWPSEEPTYKGKSARVWFEEYVRTSNRPPRVVWSYRSDGRRLIVQTSFGSYPVPMPLFTNDAQQALWIRSQVIQTRSSPSSPAWVALQTLGSNAVPELVRHLHISRLDRSYALVFTNLPSWFQQKLPNPAERRWYRTKALQTVGRLGESGRPAFPALLKLLKENDKFLRREVISAIRGIHADGQFTAVLLQLGAQQRYAELLTLADETGWEGAELTRLLGKILESPDVKLRRDAIKLLERVGRDAAPVLEQVTAALRDSDREVRLLAAQSLVYVGTNSPQVVAALRAALEDDSVMVQNVARRALANVAPEAVPSADASEPTR